jgi:hypothetical protein
MKMQTRHTRIEYLAKEIWQTFTQMSTSEVIGINVNVAKATERSQIIDTSRVVVMFVGEQYAIEAIEGNMQHLFAKVWSTINKYACCTGIYQYGHTQTAVASIRRGAYGTWASHLGDTSRGSSTKKC